MGSDFLLYGANGYTGRLIARRALEAGLRPLLAGRSGDEVRALASELGVDHRAFPLDDAGALDRALGEVGVALHAAGPFSRTAAPMAEACLRTGTHYVDITGELEVFEWLAARGKEARAAGVMLLPGAGFDVVPSDSLAAHLARRLPSATHLRLAFATLGGGVSRGTARTMLENLGRGGAVRRAGRIVRVPAAWRTRTVDLGHGPTRVTTIPWGDVATAYHSTGIPNVEVYMRVSPAQRRLMVASRYLGWLLGSSPVQRFLERRIDAAPPGPGAERRERGASLLWGEAEDERGNRVASRMRTPEGYRLTAVTSVEIVRKALGGDAPPGFQTPSLAYGPDWILSLDGVEREDLPGAGGGGQGSPRSVTL